MGHVRASSEESLRSPARGPPNHALQTTPFLISITGLAHLPHLPDQVICDFHLIVGLCEALVQFPTPGQLYSISVLQFLAEGIRMKMCKLIRKSFA